MNQPTTTRYFKNKIISDIEGKRILNSWVPVDVTELYAASDIFLTTKDETRLDILANTYLGNSKYWWAICMLNEMKHFWDWKSGDDIRIPTNISRIFSYIDEKINK